MTPSNRFSQMSLNETSPSDSPASQSDIVCIRNDAILPVPLCITPLRFGVEEPARMYLPFSVELSTYERVASQSSGNSCHSSIRWGFSPWNAAAMSSETIFRF